VGIGVISGALFFYLPQIARIKTDLYIFYLWISV